MGFFGRFAKKEDVPEAKKGIIYAPVTGTYIPLAEIPDEVFSQGFVGQGCGIVPAEGKVYAPVDGEVTTVADTGHAVGIRTAEGGEFLIHVGIDTVDMGGKGFLPKVRQGSKVKMGQLLLEFDMSAIKAAGHPDITVFLLTNSDEYPDFQIHTGKAYAAKEEAGNM